MSDLTPSPDEFDESYYLRTYPDVAAAIGSGVFSSARQHYLVCGRKEGRWGAATNRAAIGAGVASITEANVAGRAFAAGPHWGQGGEAPPATARPNPLRAFFERRKQGRGIWKWQHYFDIYDRHLSRFRGRNAHALEIGVYSGGSLEMWGDYLGTGAHLYGVDIEPSCKAYETDSVKIFIGDQSDRNFWARFRAETPPLDIVVDDGGHHFNEQVVTLEELLPQMRPGGVYICEDIHGEFHPFGSYVSGLANMLNAGDVENHHQDIERRLAIKASPVQSQIASISFYPLLVVIEKNLAPVTGLVAPKHGDQWQPFLR